MTDQLGDYVYMHVPPHGLEQEYTLLLLHGTGGNERDLIPAGTRLGRGMRMIGVRGSVEERGVRRFFSLPNDSGYDVEDIKKRAGELAIFVESCANKHDFDPLKVIPVGYSNGANIAVSVMLLDEYLFAGAVLFRPMFLFAPRDIPLLDGVPMYVGAAKNDEYASVDNTKQLVKLFEEAGAEVSLEWSEGGHELASHDIVAARKWLSNAVGR